LALGKDKKAGLIQEYRLHDSDTGSPEVQIALLTQRINDLTGHLKGSKKDFHSKRSLIKLVGKRRRLLNYLKDSDLDSYRQLIERLKLRK
jgi:small subunit ribosomal protein S15